MLNFPDAFPADDAQLIAAAVLARKFDRSLLRPAWVIQGYAESQIAPAAKTAQFMKSKPTEEEAFTALKNAADAHVYGEAAQAFPLSLVPWVSIFWYLYDLVGKLRPV